jgi:hypothetical protein
MAGLSDIHHDLCLALALWNGVDPILKERMFGLTGPQGNHGEDVKEYWWYLDGVPSHAWLRWRYHYPQAPFPYQWLIDENGRRSRDEPEFELMDTGVFDHGRYWAVDVAYAKASSTEVLAKISIKNHAAEEASLSVLPTSTALRRVGGTRSRFPPEVQRRYASGSIDLINRHRPRMTNGMAATSRPSWQIGNGKRTSSTLPWHPMTSAMKRCGCYGNRARV